MHPLLGRSRVVLAMLCLVATACGSNGGGGKTNPVREPARTERGVPVGEAVTTAIGPEGGILSSPDGGRLEIEIPAGAVSETTVFHIQPITAHAPGARGLAYRLEPHGTTFAQPVTLRFRILPVELEGTAREALLVATQDAEGRWLRVPSVAGGGAIVARTTHFSDWSLLAGYQLDVSAGTVPTGGTVAVSLIWCGYDQSSVLNDLMPIYPCEAATSEVIDSLERWEVNGIPGGNAEAGTVTPTSSFAATYRAPGEVPRSNPVAISARLQSPIGALVLVAHVEVEGGCGTYDGRPIYCAFEGETFMRLGDDEFTFEASATVRFELEVVDEERVYYLPVSGTARLLLDRRTVIDEFGNLHECVFQWTPASSPIDLDNTGGHLLVDYSTDPPMLLNGAGTTAWAATESTRCGGYDLGEETFASWFDMIDENPGTPGEPFTFRGSWDESIVSSTWELRAE